MCWLYGWKYETNVTKPHIKLSQDSNHFPYFMIIMNIRELRVRQELIGNELMDVCCDYPDQIRPIIDELVSHLDNNQLDQIEDLIVNNYGEVN